MTKAVDLIATALEDRLAAAVEKRLESRFDQLLDLVQATGHAQRFDVLERGQDDLLRLMDLLDRRVGRLERERVH